MWKRFIDWLLERSTGPSEERVNMVLLDRAARREAGQWTRNWGT